MKKQIPEKIRNGNVTVKIYTNENLGRLEYKVAYQNEEGKRTLESFRDYTEAKEHAKLVVEKLCRFIHLPCFVGARINALLPDDTEIWYLHAVDRVFLPKCLLRQFNILLLVLLPTMGCQQVSSNQSAPPALPNPTVLRVSGLDEAADLLVWKVDLGTNDYRTPRYTEIPDSDPYLIERGGAEGGIRLMSEGGRKVKEFVIPRREIEGIVRMRYDMPVVYWTDVVITTSNVALIHTDYAIAGMFHPSDVYVLPRSRNSFDYLKVIETNAWEVHYLKLLYPALLFYETAQPKPLNH